MLIVMFLIRSGMSTRVVFPMACSMVVRFSMTGRGLGKVAKACISSGSYLKLVFVGRETTHADSPEGMFSK